jgi:hypothetical protein
MMLEFGVFPAFEPALPQQIDRRSLAIDQAHAGVPAAVQNA